MRVQRFAIKTKWKICISTLVLITHTDHHIYIHTYIPREYVEKLAENLKIKEI